MLNRQRVIWFPKLTMIALIMVFLFNNLWSQNSDTIELSLKSIYTDRAFSIKGYGPAHFLDDGKGYTTLERSASGEGRDIIRYDSKSGKREILIPSGRLIPSGKKKPLTISNYTWSHDHSKLMIFTNTRFFLRPSNSP